MDNALDMEIVSQTTKIKMIKIKQTKSVRMEYDEYHNGIRLVIDDILNYDSEYDRNVEIFIPMSKIFQVQRGITSSIQRFYGKKNTKKR